MKTPTRHWMRSWIGQYAPPVTQSLLLPLHVFFKWGPSIHIQNEKPKVLSIFVWSDEMLILYFRKYFAVTHIKLFFLVTSGTGLHQAGIVKPGPQIQQQFLTCGLMVPDLHCTTVLY